MEINEMRRTRRNEAAGRPAAEKKPEGRSDRPQSRSTRREDRLALSQQALKMLEEHSRQVKEEQERRKLERERTGGKSELDSVLKALKVMQRCQKIAARIMAGDKVPPEDEQYLMDNDPEGYKLAIAMRRPKEDPKEWESVLEDEEERDGSSSAQEVSGCGGSGGSADSADGGEAPA